MAAASFSIGGKEYKDVIPYFTIVYYPKVAAEYAPVFFVPGMYGYFPPEMYSDTLTQLAGRGYIVLAVSPVIPTSDARDSPVTHASSVRLAGEVDKMIKTLEWLMDNLNQKVLPEQGIAAQANWNYLAVGAHSAGCDTVLEMVLNSSITAKAAAYLEPFSFHLAEPLPPTVPSLSIGTAYCEQKLYCCIPGLDYIKLYSDLHCPRLSFNVTGYGHCDILDDWAWEVCHAIHFCKTDKTNDRVMYRRYISGVMAAWYGTYVQGNPEQLQYLTTPSDMPVPVTRLQVDVNCKG